MRAMVLDAPRSALRAAEIPTPEPAAGEVLIEVGACGICRTDLHVVDGELSEPQLPLVPGPPDRRPGGRRGRAVRHGRPRGGAVAGMDVR